MLTVKAEIETHLQLSTLHPAVAARPDEAGLHADSRDRATTMTTMVVVGETTTRGSPELAATNVPEMAAMSLDETATRDQLTTSTTMLPEMTVDDPACRTRT